MSAEGFVSAEINLEDVERGLRALVRAGRNLAPAFRALKPEMRTDQREHAALNEGPDGKWRPLAKTTLAEYAKRGKRRPARMLGKLVTAVQYTADATGVRGKSMVRWSGSHMDGDRTNHGGVLPARSFLWLSTKFLSHAESTMSDYVLGAYGGA